VDYQDYLDYIAEEVKSWSYMKFPYLRSIGKNEGWYTVGPLARLNTCDFIPTPLAQKEFEEFKAYTNGKPNNMSMHMHWARLIETLHAAEMMKELLYDPDISGEKLVRKGNKTIEGVGLIEAPRGTLFHHYKIDNNDQIEMANLIVSTTNNNTPMNRAVELVAKANMTGSEKITEGMLNAVETAIRAYDPCLSCATHALGKMPLEISLYDSRDELIDVLRSE
jgi:NAD-reducing hydrogenase large subunit